MSRFDSGPRLQNLSQSQQPVSFSSFPLRAASGEFFLPSSPEAFLLEPERARGGNGKFFPENGGGKLLRAGTPENIKTCGSGKRIFVPENRAAD